MSKTVTEKNKGGKPLKFGTVEELQTKVDAYFESKDAYIITEDKTIFAPTVSGLALFLDVDRKTITNYANRDEYFPTIKRARARIEQHLEQRLYGNNVTGVIFNLKNNYGWSDRQESENDNSNQPVGRIQLEVVSANHND